MSSLTRGDRILAAVERAGNRLPHPFVLFLGLFGVVAVASTALAAAGAQALVPGADAPTVVRGFFTGEGLTWFSTNLVENFIGFPPLGTVLTILLAVGLAERTGLLAASVRLLFGRAPRWALPYAVGIVGVSANVMGDASFVVVPPLAALVFAAAGRHPVAGLLGGFAAAAAGFSASPLVTTHDALLAGITNAAASGLPDPGTPVTAVSNYFVNAVAAVVLGVVAGFVIDRVLEPRLERLGVSREPVGEPEPGAGLDLSAVERRALRWAGAAALLTAAAIVVAAVLPGSPWRNDAGGFLPQSPLLSSVVTVVVIMFAVPALVYGVAVREIRTPADVPEMLAKAVAGFAPFIVLAFVLGQFIALFTWSGLGEWLAVRGADGLRAVEFTGFGAILAFVGLAALLNLVIISGSSMWTLLAAVFVPLFVLLGYEPALVQSAFRIGDSVTQVITPLNPYLIVLLGYLRRYEPGAGLGTTMARMLPFVVPFLVVWVLILTAFFVLGLPLGPGSGSTLPAGTP